MPRDHRRRGKRCGSHRHRPLCKRPESVRSFDKDAQAKALNGAISAAIKSFSKDALDYIKEIFGDDTVGYLTTRIQAQIDLNKAAKAAQQIIPA